MARLFMFAIAIYFVAVVTAGISSAEDGSGEKIAADLESRISKSEDRLGAIEAKLATSLEFIRGQITELRGGENREADRQVETNQPSVATEDAASGGGEKPAGSQASADEKGSEDASKDMLTLETRAAKVERALAGIEQHLSKLDDIAEQLDQMKRSRKGLVEVSGRVKKQGTVFINNWTDATHLVEINGVQYYIRPGRVRVGAEYGPLTTQLPWFETPNRWKASHWEKVGDEYQITLNLRSP